MTGRNNKGTLAVHASRNPDPMDRRQFLGRMLRAGLIAGLAPGFIPPIRAAALPRETCRAWRAMGTLIEVRVPDLPRPEAIDAIRGVRQRVETLEAAMTLYRPQSPLVTLNHQTPERWMRIPPELMEGLAAALRGYERSSGAFDPTVAPAMRAWGLFDLRGGTVDRALLENWRRRPSATVVELDTDNRRVRFLDSRVEVDLGGVGKGIAVDHALGLLAKAGSRSALVNLGGSIGVLGSPAAAPKGWPIGIAHPRRPGELWNTVKLRSGHLATSGDYERWIQTSSGRTHHLLDPTTGEPARGVASLTAWAPTGTEADLESTIRFIGLGRNETPVRGSALLTVMEQDGDLVEIRGQADSGQQFF